MSVKDKHHVARYVTQVSEIQAALANLYEFFDAMPVPDSAGELPSLHYGHIGTVSEIHTRLRDLSQIADAMFQRNASR